mgnify:CR=1 FL=1
MKRAGAAQLAHEAIESMPAPGPGWSWTVVNDMRYTQACRDGIPTLYLEYHFDDDIEMIYLVGQHDLAPEVKRDV